MLSCQAVHISRSAARGLRARLGELGWCEPFFSVFARAPDSLVERSDCHECMDSCGGAGLCRDRLGDPAEGIDSPRGLPRLPTAFAQANLVVENARAAWQMGLPGVWLPDGRSRPTKCSARHLAASQIRLGSKKTASILHPFLIAFQQILRIA